MTDELAPDPFERRCVGTHNAFVLRTNAAHVEASVKAIRQAWAEQSTFDVANVVKMRKAA